MDAWAERLGDGFLRVVEQVIPPAARLEDHSVLIGQCLILVFAMAVLWSVSGILRRR
ncbi:MAG TPA: hypothetical protein VJU81_01250 [Methylomirabilota bacterium]|nr:hypothetical protein [Methylomirabilota bacterium]